MIHKLLKKVFRKWDLVYSTQDVGEYATMKGRLMQNGVEHKTKTISSGEEKEVVMAMPAPTSFMCLKRMPIKRIKRYTIRNSPIRLITFPETVV